MLWPPDFYRVSQDNTTGYESNPPGTLDVNRMLADLPAWECHGSSLSRVPKTLIFSDWSMSIWPDDLKIQAKTRIKQLMEDGFSIYIWLENPIALNPGEDIRYFEKSFIVAETAEIIQQQASEKLGLNPEHILVLDAFKIKQLCLNDRQHNLQLQTLSVRSLLLAQKTTFGTIDALCAFIKRHKPVVHTIYHDEFSSEANQLIQAVRLRCPDIAIEQNFVIKNLYPTQEEILLREGELELAGVRLHRSAAHSIKISSEMNYQAIQNMDFNNITSLSLKGLGMPADHEQCHDPFQKADLSQVVELTLSEVDLSSPIIQFLFKKLKKLEVLEITSCKQTSLLPFENLDVTALKTLDIEDTTLSKTAIQAFLKQSTAVTYLRLSRFDIPYLEGIQITHLKTLTLNEVEINRNTLNSLLKNSPCLENLSLSYLELNIHSGDLERVSLNHLIHLVIEHTEVNAPVLQDLLKRTSNLQTLKFKNCRNLSPEVFESVPPSLRRLTLKHSRFYTDILLKILDVASGLETLVLKHPDDSLVLNVTMPHLVSMRPLKNLRHLVFEHITVSSNLLKTILIRAPYLESIRCPAIQDSANFSSISLNAIRDIQCIFLDALQNILNNPTIKPRKLLLVSHDGVDLSFKNVDLNELRELHAIRLETKTLVFILNHAPNLGVLVIEDNYHLTPQHFQVEKTSALKKLHLVDSKIDSNMLIGILNQSPGLQVVEIIGTHQIKNRSLMEARYPDIHFEWNEGLWVKDTASIHHRDGPLVTERHDPTVNLDYIPPPERFKFQYTGISSPPHRVMIEKLCQYMSLENRSTEYIPQIQGGICLALSRLFQTMSIRAWCSWYDGVSDWNGTEDALKDYYICHDSKQFLTIREALEQLYIQVKDSYFIPSGTRRRYYAGQSLEAYLKQRPPQSLVLLNPWHAVAIKPDASSAGIWFCYNANNLDVHRVEFEQLMGWIDRALGSLIMVDDPSIMPEQAINPIPDISAFIKAGGLLSLSLVGVENHADLVNQLLSSEFELSEEALEGLLLRGTDGCPAWARGLSGHHEALRSLTIRLLNQFFKHYEAESRSLLAYSMLVLSDAQKQSLCAIIDESSGLRPEDKRLLSELLSPSPPLPVEQSSVVCFPERSSAPKESLKDWFNRLDSVSSKGQNYLFTHGSNERVQAFQLALYAFFKSRQRPCFYVSEPSGLICSAGSVVSEGGHGVIRSGPTGALYAFLEANREKSPVLLVDYTRFDEQSRVRWNGLVDEVRKVDGIELPESTLIIGSHNPRDGIVYGQDFTRRFHHQVDLCHLEGLALTDLPPESAVDSEGFCIHLFNGRDWKSQLLGNWIFEQNGLRFQAGALQEALLSGAPVLLENAPWYDLSFRLLIEKALIDGYIETPEGQIPCPKSTRFLRRSGYDFTVWVALIESVEFEWIYDFRQPPPYVLNPERFSSFIQQYQCDNERKMIETTPGFIALHRLKDSDTPMSILVTRDLSIDHWARLLHLCKMEGVRIRLKLAPGVILPKELAQAMGDEALKVVDGWEAQGIQSDAQMLEMLPSTQVYTTNDQDALLKRFSQEGAWQFIPIDECLSVDLLEPVSGWFDVDGKRFIFTQEKKALLQALEANQSVILSGYFSERLLDELIPFLIKRMHQSNPPGRLLIIGQSGILSCFSPEVVYISEADKWRLLNQLGYAPHLIQSLRETITDLDKTPFCHLEACLRMADKTLDWEAPWVGMEGLQQPTHAPVFQARRARQVSEAFEQNRLQAVTRALEQAPFACLTGLTGTGKTTFVQRHFNNERYALYEGCSGMMAWATDKTNKQKVLFLDEANLSKRGWSEFESLLYRRPGILIEGRYYDLTPQVGEKLPVVLFAMNPQSYSEDRNLPSFLRRHGQAVLFEPLPLELILERMIKPLFEETPLQKDTGLIADMVFDCYGRLLMQTDKELLMTPRDCQMIALLLVSQAETFETLDVLEKTERIHEACRTVCGAYLSVRPVFMEDDVQVNFQKVTYAQTARQQKNFVVTASRQPLWQDMASLMHLRDYRRQQTDSPQIQRGGLAGLVIEGAPGIGKSELVTARLKNLGFSEIPYPYTGTALCDKGFYRLPISMQLSEKINLLYKAFDEGAVVVVDEFNAAPMIESYLNAFLSGKTPEGRSPQKPGFFIFATQNPPSCEGREQESNALKRRMIFKTLLEYTQEERLLIKDQAPKRRLFTLFNGHADAPDTDKDLKRPRCSI